MQRYILENDVYFTQIDNTIAPKYSCFPTSMGMGFVYCLQEIGKDKTDIGCPEDTQIEDHINKISMSPTTMRWIRNNVSKYGKWMIQTTPRENFYVEEYIFNLLMNPLGYKCKFTAKGTFLQYCELLEKNKLPIILKGDFRPETKVGGHLVCGIGYDKDKETLIVNDPYGNALKSYKDKDGENMEYPFNHWFKQKNDNMYFIYIEKI